jgi:heme ABC exporter ATP-binding subunit CcmA
MTCTLTGISKSFLRNNVLRELSITFKPGERVLLLGANGAGKSTLLRLCAGLSRPDSGTISFDGAPSSRAPLGYSSHRLLLYPQLSVRENLSFFAALVRREKTVDETIERWALTHYAEAPVSSLSKGLQMRVALCRTLLTSPRFLFLDEPSAALDQHSLEIFLNELNRNFESHQQQTLAVIATHDIARLQSFASRAVTLSAGKIGYDSAAESAGSIEGAIETYLGENR